MIRCDIARLCWCPVCRAETDDYNGQDWGRLVIGCCGKGHQWIRMFRRGA